ncbi:hypothetical protein CK203_034192 [Vitis vinifera]|uniref:Uncharacterized protein n=1 Tax=Vitis vinifera TaxID=29760 RepID=A0A438IEY0_VITVI|nr:hypothetical protein CK203_034192 [Vitis vinifera]
MKKYTCILMMKGAWWLGNLSHDSFVDGSYSRGPVEIPVGELDESKYYLSPTFKFEQVEFWPLLYNGLNIDGI